MGLQGRGLEVFGDWVILFVVAWFLDGQAVDLALDDDVWEEVVRI